MRRLRRAKIVATLGPASSEAGMIQRLFEAGTDVFRINMSHTTHDRMRELVRLIRGVEKRCERPVGVLVDLQGPKLRPGAGRRLAGTAAASRDPRGARARPHSPPR
jgi:pyruvate kinase